MLLLVVKVQANSRKCSRSQYRSTLSMKSYRLIRLDKCKMRMSGLIGCMAKTRSLEAIASMNQNKTYFQAAKLSYTSPSLRHDARRYVGPRSFRWSNG